MGFLAQHQHKNTTHNDWRNVLPKARKSKLFFLSFRRGAFAVRSKLMSLNSVVVVFSAINFENNREKEKDQLQTSGPFFLCFGLRANDFFSRLCSTFRSCGFSIDRVRYLPLNVMLNCRVK